MTDNGPVDATVLVTGGAGFIGGHLVDVLVRENEVRVLDDFSTGDRDAVNPDATVIEGDVRDPGMVWGAMDDVDVVLHEAAIVSVDRSIDDPMGSNEVNVRGTLAVLEAARMEGARVVTASSAAVYGDPAEVPITEDAPVAPTSPYGLEKLTVEGYCRLYDELYGVDALPLRYFNVYGPGQRGGDYSGVIDVFVRQALADEPITVHGDGSQTRDFVAVGDVVKATLRAAASGAGPAPLNVATGESVTIRELAELVRDVCDSSSEIVHEPPRSGDIERSQAAVSGAREAIGFEADIPLREGLTSVVEWVRATGAADGA